MNETVYSGDKLALGLATHNDRLIQRSVVSCPTGCHCDWGMSCGTPYLGRVTKPNLRATLINKTPFELKVKRKSPCNKTAGELLAVILKVMFFLFFPSLSVSLFANFSFSFTLSYFFFFFSDDIFFFFLLLLQGRKFYCGG